jgi:hypothetical protein
MTEDEQTAIDCVAAYLETAMVALDRGDILMAKAALRRCAQHMLKLPRWDAVNGEAML